MKEPLLQIDPVWGIEFATLTLAIVVTSLWWTEAKRPAPQKWLRLFFATLIGIALSGILFRPQLAHPTSDRIVVLTQGYDAHQVDSLLDANPGLKLVHTRNTIPYRNSTEIPSENSLASIGDKIDAIAGYGLTRAERDAIGTVTPTLLHPAPPEGIIYLQAPPDAIAGRPTHVEGVFNNNGDHKALRIHGPGGIEDSATLGHGLQPFSLEVLPKASGVFLYAVQVDDDTVGRISVSVRNPPALDVLFLLQYPTFESRQLKTALEGTHRMMIRYEYSRNKYRIEYINRSPATLNRLNERFLSQFDVLIIDTDAIGALSPSEFRQLKDAVDDGLGVVTLFNQTPSRGDRARELLNVSFRAYARDTAHLDLRTGKVSINTFPVHADASDAIIPVHSSGQRTISGYTFHGFGKAGFTLARQTYEMALRGDSAAYAELWMPFVERLARMQRGGYTVDIWNAFPWFEDEPILFRIVSAGSAPSLRTGNAALPLREDAYIDDVWYGKYWAGGPGWNTISVNGDSSITLYVSRADEWRSLELANRLRENQDLRKSKPQEMKASAEFSPIPSWIFYLLFLVGGGMLWLLPKL